MSSSYDTPNEYQVPYTHQAYDNGGNGSGLEPIVDSSEDGNSQGVHISTPILTPEEKATLSKAEAKREYGRRYYQLHKERAREYQRQYNLTHKKKAGSRKGGGRSVGFEMPREVIKTTFNSADIMHSPVEKTIRILEKILNHERFFTI